MNIRMRDSLEEILETIVKSYKFTGYMTKEEFMADDKSVFAIIRVLEIFGLRSKNLKHQRKDSKLRNLFSKLPLRDIIGISDKLNRPYAVVVQPEILWETINNDFPIIETEIKKILEITKYDDSVREYTNICLRTELCTQLTPNFLGLTVYPYLMAVSSIQKIINQINKSDENEVEIKSINKYNPLNVSLKGATQTVNLISENVIPWRRKHAKAMAKYFEIEKKVEIESKKADILNKRANILKTKAETEKLKTDAEVDRQKSEKLRLESEKQRLENEKENLDLHRSKIQLALDFISQIAPNLQETEKITYLIQLLPQIDILITSELELDVIK